MARHKKQKKRYWLGNVAAGIIIVLTGYMVVNDDHEPPDIQPADQTIARGEVSIDRAISRPRAVLDEAEELSALKKLEIDIPETPTPTSAPAGEEEPPEVTDQLYATEDLRVRAGPSKDDDVIEVVSRGSKLDVTGNAEGEWAQIIYDEEIAWVSSEFLSETEPPPPPPPPAVYYEECGVTSSPAEAGLTRDALHVLRCIEENFPEIDDYGGVAARANKSDHPSGRAVDAMIPLWSTLSGNNLGWRIAEWVRKNARCLGVTYVIFDAKIWNADRDADGWRSYSHPSGSTTATTLHLDHVHVSVHGDAGYNCKG